MWVLGQNFMEVLEHHYHLSCKFKRPNDVLVEGRKICGILVESSSRASGIVDAIVVGVGLNVNALPEEMVDSSTSMKFEKGKEYDREMLLKRLLHQLQEDLTSVYDYTS